LGLTGELSAVMLAGLGSSEAEGGSAGRGDGCAWWVGAAELVSIAGGLGSGSRTHDVEEWTVQRERR
jgi:hypothetical protein